MNNLVKNLKSDVSVKNVTLSFTTRPSHSAFQLVTVCPQPGFSLTSLTNPYTHCTNFKLEIR